MSDPSNIMSYPDLQPVNQPPRRYRKLKMLIYLVILAGLAFFVYTRFIHNSSPLTSIKTTSANQNAPTPSPAANTGYWDQSQVALPSYPPITSTTDLHQAATSIKIPDFSDNYSKLKNEITQ